MTRATASMPVGTGSPGRASISARTLRKDNWWKSPVLTVLGLTAWVVYAVVRTMTHASYFVGPYHYLSPFTSPCVTASCPKDARDFGTWLPHFPPIIPLAIISLTFLLGFRLTCYYYRKAYYRSYWQSPPACAVAEPHAGYSGETKFPLIIQNIHRYFWMVAVLISLVNTYDVIRAFRGADGGVGLGLGTLVMLANVVMLWMYTLGCHSCRHITAGRLRNFSKHRVRYKAWTWVSWLNARHMQFAWTTLATLAITDFYIWMVSSGVFNDPRIFN